MTRPFRIGLCLVVFSLVEVILAAESRVPKQYEMPFAAKTRDEALAWQGRARARLLKLVARQVPRLATQEVPIDQVLGGRAAKAK